MVCWDYVLLELDLHTRTGLNQSSPMSSVRNVCALLTVWLPLICGEGKPFGCVSESLRGLQGLVGR